MMPFGPPRRQPSKPKGRFHLITSLYTDEFKFNVVKSGAMFLFGIYLARELQGVEIAPK